MDSDEPPTIHVRWFQVGVPQLLSITPITLNSTITWRPLTRRESDACEKAWLTSRNLQGYRSHESLIDNTSGAEGTAELSEEDDQDDNWMGIPIERDQLFEVDVRTMKLYPVYWKTSGPRIDVMRAVWMYDETLPVDMDLANKIEEAYLAVKPWQSFYQDELDTARELGPEAQDKLSLQLEGTDYRVIFDDAGSARLISPHITSRLTSVFSSVRARAGIINAAGTVVYRGSDEAASRTRTKLPHKADRIEDGIAAPQVQIEAGAGGKDHTREKSGGGTSNPSSSRGSGNGNILIAEDDEATETITDLVFIVHGIGQGLTAQYEAYNFVYATNLFRNVARKEAAEPALSSIMRSNRVQFLPVQWRSSLKTQLDEERVKHDDGLDNVFTMADITQKGSIPYVRELTNNMLLDIPLFMSHHRERMIQSVCTQANRAYRLWCARNPSFEKNGRVHILAHSLGTALVSDILSVQPTIVPPLSSIPRSEATGTNNRFLFNTSALFMIGSPLSIFLHLSQAQLIARKGRERTINSPPDEALDREGLFGCLAVDSIYNVFNPADPIAYLINPCVDSEHAKDLAPSAVPNVTAHALAPLSHFGARVSKLFDGVHVPFSSTSSAKTHARSGSNSSSSNLNLASPSSSLRPANLHRAVTEGGIDLEMAGGGSDQTLEGTRAERRFLALNPHGTLDYALPSEGNISEYVDMITAHSSYWADPNLAAFLLAEIFSKKTDSLRTGLGVR